MGNGFIERVLILPGRLLRPCGILTKSRFVALLCGRIGQRGVQVMIADPLRRCLQRRLKDLPHESELALCHQRLRQSKMLVANPVFRCPTDGGHDSRGFFMQAVRLISIAAQRMYAGVKGRLETHQDAGAFKGVARLEASKFVLKREQIIPPIEAEQTLSIPS